MHLKNASSILTVAHYNLDVESSSAFKKVVISFVFLENSF